MELHLTERCRLLFARPTTWANEGQTSQDQCHDDLETAIPGAPGVVLGEPSQRLGSSIDEGLRQLPRNRRKPSDVQDMIKDSFVCCKTRKCVERFSTGQASTDELRKQQSDIERLRSCRERTAWVKTMTPFHKPAKNEGSMVAGGTVVCNNFFARAFAVSKWTICSAKGTCAARSSKRWRA